MDKNMKIALVGPGLMPIPPEGWGAIESLIWKYYQKLKELGHEVVIYNSQDLKEVSKSINNGDFDFVHIHYDGYISYFLRKLNKPFCITSHYGLILQREKWANGYLSIFADFLFAPGIIALSKDIKKLYLDNDYKRPIYVLKNGIRVNDFSFVEKGNGRVLCLGKIEKRKRQTELADILDGLVDIDFVGPIADLDFKEGKTTKYLGTWTREEVLKNLTNYSTLILLSRGEAAPLVVVEALASGVPVVISRSASANLEMRPFITILDDEESSAKVISTALKKSITSNLQDRYDIRKYALDNFDDKIIMKDYQNIIHDFIEKSKNMKVSYSAGNKFIKENFPPYIFSRIWLFLSRVKIIRRIYKLKK